MFFFEVTECFLAFNVALAFFFQVGLENVDLVYLLLEFVRQSWQFLIDVVRDLGARYV